MIKVFVSKQIRTLEVGFSPGRWWCRKGRAVCCIYAEELLLLQKKGRAEDC